MLAALVPWASLFNAFGVTEYAFLVFLCAMMVGCGKSPPPARDSGSREVVTKYFCALGKKDWDGAYALLHADVKKDIDRDSYAQRAAVYCKQLGLPIGKVIIRSCDEQGDQGIAHVTLQYAAGSAKRYKESIFLKKDADRWRILLPDNFGR